MRALRLLSVLVLCACDGPVVEDGGVPPVDAGHDASEPPPRVREELPAPGPLRAGVAQVLIPAPLGIGTMGFGAIGQAPSPTPFSQMFPGTTRQHAALSFRAVALSRGDAHEVVLVRMDTVGVFQQLREAVLDEVERRTGRRMNDSLVLAGNHTHSGPGRMLMTTGALVALGDTFFPEFYDRIVQALADVVERALDDLAPAELGLTMASTSVGHSDRRCENDSLDQPQESGELPLIAVRRAGRLDAVVASYGYHGTVLGIGDLTLSGDFGSVVEQRIEERFDHPVMVLFFNSWGGDMAPGSVPEPPGTTGPVQPGGFDRMERVGDAVADVVVPAIGSMSYAGDVPVRARTYRVELSRAAIGYPDGVFGYPHGGAFCGIGSDGNCVDSTPIDGLDTRCVPISIRENLPKQTVLTAGQIGSFSFVTGPGEWSTALAAGVLDRVRAVSGGEAMFIGYANDYTGYSLNEVDWWQGGYEAAGALWGPGQGDYLAARLRESFETFHDQWTEPPWWQPARVAPFSGYDGYAPYVPEAPVGLGTLAADVAGTAGSEDVVTFTVHGSDPWLGVPIATLETASGDPVRRANGTVVTSESYDLWVDLVPTPAYAEMARATERTFAWTFHFPVTRRAGTTIPTLSGGYRFRVAVPASSAPVEVVTGTFTVE